MGIHYSITYICGKHALYNKLILHDQSVVLRNKVRQVLASEKD